MTTEAELLERARSGDVAAFERLVRIHDERFRAVAYRMLGDPMSMDDALQDAYVRAFRGIAGFRGDARFTTWMYRIVTTTCIDHLRRENRRPEDLVVDDGRPTPPSGQAEPDPAGDAVTRRLDLRRALDRLSPEHRAALLLVDGEGLSYDDAGEALGVPAGTVSSRISRARREMRTLLRPSRPDRPGGDR